MPLRPVPRVIHTHARALHNHHRSGFRRRGDVKIVTEQVVRVQAPVNVQRAAEQAGTAGPAPDMAHRLDGAQQDGGRMTFALRHHVHAVIHPVDEIDVGVARRTEHDLGPLGQPPGRMRREIVRAEIRLHLHNPADAFPVDQIFAQQFPRNHNRVPVVK